MPDEEVYAEREQALVKHTVLAAYLKALSFKLAQARTGGLTLNYVDGFSGPWKPATRDLSDTSPDIAMRVLRDVKAVMKAKGRSVRVRCLFIERDAAAHAELRQLLGKYPDVETQAIHGEFDASLPKVATFVREGQNAFGFVFIDPTGWTGFGLKALQPIFTAHSEMLVNFMTGHIKRFLDHPGTPDSLDDLFNGDQWRACASLSGTDRDDCLARTYCDAVKRMLGFQYATYAIVLQPRAERTHYHLVYATNSLVGLRAFRDAERRGMSVQAVARGQAQRRHASARDPHQPFLFPPAQSPSTSAEELARRYHMEARLSIEAQPGASRELAYDNLLAIAMTVPMTTYAKLNEWLREWKSSGRIEFAGLPPGKRIPELGCGHRVIVKE